MRRRQFLLASALAVLAPSFAQAQSLGGMTLTPITPQSPLESTFISALNDPGQRPAFRRQLLASQVAVAMVNSEHDAPPLLVHLQGTARAAAIFTSRERLTGVLGQDAAARMMSGHDALTLLRNQHVVINYRLIPMLTLDPEDVEHMLVALPEQ